MNTVKRIGLVLLAVAVAGVVVSLICFRQREPKADETTGRKAKRVLLARAQRRSVDSQALLQDVIAKQKPESRTGEKPDVDMFLDGLSDRDKKLVQSVRDALDEDDFTSVLKAARVALKSKTPEVREAVVEALGWFGPQALPELTPLMADPDENVAGAAISQWELALDEIEESNTRAAIATSVMKTLTNKDALETIVCQITHQDDDFAILEALVSIIESDNKVAAEVAREEYESLTGEEWTDIDAANKWLMENYDPPESDDATGG